jgi:hypothetical protein
MVRGRTVTADGAQRERSRVAGWGTARPWRRTEIDRALAVVMSTLNDHELDQFDAGRVQQIVSAASRRSPSTTAVGCTTSRVSASDTAIPLLRVLGGGTSQRVRSHTSTLERIYILLEAGRQEAYGSA